MVTDDLSLPSPAPTFLARSEANDHAPTLLRVTQRTHRCSNGKTCLPCVKTCLLLTSLTCENVPGSPSAIQIGVQRSRVKSLRAEEGEPGTEATPMHSYRLTVMYLCCSSLQVVVVLVAIRLQWPTLSYVRDILNGFFLVYSDHHV